MEKVRRPRVLVVDDERAFTDLLADFLEEEGYAVDRAYDGEQAMSILQSNPAPDLVLTDVMMPRVSGTELFAMSRRLDGGKRTPFVLLSAGPDPGIREDRVSFMSKPLDLVELLNRVEALVPSLEVQPG